MDRDGKLTPKQKKVKPKESKTLETTIITCFFGVILIWMNGNSLIDSTYLNGVLEAAIFAIMAGNMLPVFSQNINLIHGKFLFAIQTQVLTHPCFLHHRSHRYVLPKTHWTILNFQGALNQTDHTSPPSKPMPGMFMFSLLGNIKKQNKQIKRQPHWKDDEAHASDIHSIAR